MATEPIRKQGALTLRVEIQGRVQGVGYRWWTLEQATARGLAGWVRNREDGSVEALFSGEAAAVEEMVEACRRGPGYARVSFVGAEPAAAPDRDGFHLLSTH
ncbi:acylphosphatase [Paludibacterium yongneupense]|uniref:acylphosphatase n=1 Tax=Paludibacterium yongneupense TaxID=400061 RepID=UPI000413C903|nr:acylphosphatase [Paludibacterium yongneupense]